MRRFLLLALLAGSLLPLPGPARAQATADQLNKLSLEALTAPSAGGGRSYAGRGYQARRSSRSGYAHTRHYGYARRSYAHVGRGYRGPRYAMRSRSVISRRPAAGHHGSRLVRPAYRRGYRR